MALDFFWLLASGSSGLFALPCFVFVPLFFEYSLQASRFVLSLAHSCFIFFFAFFQFWEENREHLPSANEEELVPGELVACVVNNKLVAVGTVRFVGGNTKLVDGHQDGTHGDVFVQDSSRQRQTKKNITRSVKTHLKAHSLNTSSIHMIKTPSQNTFSKHLIKTPSQNTISKHLLKTPSQTPSQTLTTACVSV